MMSPRIRRIQAPVCQLCDFISAGKGHRIPIYRTLNLRQSSRQLSTSRTLATQKNDASHGSSPAVVSTIRLSDHQRGFNSVSANNLENEMQEVRNLHKRLESSTKVPKEKDILSVLTYFDVIAEALVEPNWQMKHERGTAASANGTASALLSIDDSLSPGEPQIAPQTSQSVQKYIDELSRIAWQTMELPTVFITQEILKQYINIQAKLRKAFLIPGVLQLYASKPQPIEDSDPIKYSLPNPDKAKAAIPPAVADSALQAAIDTKDFQAATAIVDASYAKKAFRRSKFLRRGLLPSTAIIAGPAAAYVVATKLATYQSSMEPQTATNLAFFGIIAYMGFTSTIGLVALTTANDQMDRVTWAQGTPLRQRWIREEERAAIDKIAGAWGFRERWRRGEEEGLEWDTLRDWIGLRGMVLDQVSLMEGME